MVKELTSSTFDEEIKISKQPVVVDFWAEWCGPCRMFSPIVEELGEEYSNQVTVCKLNVDDAQDIAARYGVMSIPTLILFKDGKEAGQLVGVHSKESVEKFLGV